MNKFLLKNEIGVARFFFCFCHFFQLNFFFVFAIFFN